MFFVSMLVSVFLSMRLSILEVYVPAYPTVSVLRDTGRIEVDSALRDLTKQPKLGPHGMIFFSNIGSAHTHPVKGLGCRV